MLNTYPCLNNAMCLEQYLEMVYRWSFYFNGTDLCNLIAATFFNAKTIGNKNPTIVKSTCIILHRICVKNLPQLLID